MNSTILKAASAIAAMAFLVNIGQAVLKNSHSTDWMSVDEVAAVAKEKGIVLDKEVPKAKELEQQLRPLFLVNDEVFKAGIQVVGMERRIGWDLVFTLRFYKYNPQHRHGTAAGGDCRCGVAVAEDPQNIAINFDVCKALRI